MKQFVVTIARSYGSEGGEIGEELAKELGIKCYDRQLLRMASDISGIHERFFGQVDEEETKPPLFRAVRNVYAAEPVPPEHPGYISPRNLFAFQTKLIRDLADRESCVIVGRCADYVLRDRENVVKVFIYAPLEVCVGRISERYGLTRQEAKSTIREIDSRRTSYYKYHTGMDWRDVMHYDLCLNSGSLSVPQCVAFLKKYLEKRSGA
ncbi:MAG: AAA family ATPase [Christensenellales bacterium]